jgi:hypothetical protein
MLDGLSLDPYVVLGVARGASAREVRDAYHQKTKKHHPDLGGDDWAFKIVVRAYEVLSGAQGHAARWQSATPVPAHPHVPEAAPDTGQVVPGVHDKDLAPSRIVQVEMIWMRYEVGDVVQFLAEPQGDRNLSGTLRISWPDKSLSMDAVPGAEDILHALAAAYDEARAKTRATSSTSHIDGGRFEAWLGYPSGQAAQSAFKVFHAALKARGLGTRQWTRDITIPRDES